MPTKVNVVMIPDINHISEDSAMLEASEVGQLLLT